MLIALCYFLLRRIFRNEISNKSFFLQMTRTTKKVLQKAKSLIECDYCEEMFSRNGMHQHVYRAHGKGSRPEEIEYYIEREPSKKKPGLKKNILW